MPKTKKKISAKKAVKKPAKKTSAMKKSVAQKKAPVVRRDTSAKEQTFSVEFTNALLVIFAAGMMLFAYVIFRIYG